MRGLLRTSLNTEGAHGVPSPAPSAAGRAAPAEGRPDRTLAELPVGEDGVVAAVGGERLFRRRLLELGLLPGTAVRTVRLAELSGLLEVEARGSVLSLRLADARAILLEGGPRR